MVIFFTKILPLFSFLLTINRDVVDVKSVVNVASLPTITLEFDEVPIKTTAVCPVDVVLIRYKPKLLKPVSTSSPGANV